MRLFRTNIFGGYKKSDVARYIQRLEFEVDDLEKELETLREESGNAPSGEKSQSVKENPAYDLSVIEESIAEIRLLRQENERLEQELERLSRDAPQKEERKESAAGAGSGK